MESELSKTHRLLNGLAGLGHRRASCAPPGGQRPRQPEKANPFRCFSFTVAFHGTRPWPRVWAALRPYSLRNPGPRDPLPSASNLLCVLPMNTRLRTIVIALMGMLVGAWSFL